MLLALRSRIKRPSRAVVATVAALLIGTVPLAVVNASADPPDGLKGTWDIAITLPAGTVPAEAKFKDAGDGTIELSGAKLPLSWRDISAGPETFSVAFEIPAANSPFGQGATVVLRGARPSSTSITGQVKFITDAEIEVPGTFAGTKR